MKSPRQTSRSARSRLSGFTDDIILRRLEHESDRLLGFGLFVALLVHSLIAGLWTVQQPPVRATRPVEVYLRISQPRMNKPFRISVSQSVRTMQRQLKYRDPSTLPGANYSSPDSKILEDHFPVLESSLLIDSNTYDSGKYDTGEFTPAIPRFIDKIKRYSENIISLKDELLTVDDLDRMLSERKKGLLLVNPNDPNALTGYLYIPHLYSQKDMVNISPHITELAQAFNSNTGIKVKCDKHIMLPPQTPILAPFVYIGIKERWEYVPSETKAIADYVYDGGFVMIENLTPWLLFCPAEASLRQFIKDAFGPKAQLERIPDDHPIYHTLFDFDDGPPIGLDLTNILELKLLNISAGGPVEEFRKKPVEYLEGIFIDGRLAVLYADKGYSLGWGDINLSSKMGINIVLYAMSQMDQKTVIMTDYTLDPNKNTTLSRFQPIRMKKNDSLWPQ